MIAGGHTRTTDGRNPASKLRRRCIAGGVLGAALLVLARVLPPHLQRAAAAAIADAPNRGAGVPEPAPGELRIEVGPPHATLSVAILDADAPAPKGTVFVLHGIRADKGDVRPWARALAAAGFRAVLVDLRGHGRSTGDWLSYGVVESRDLAQVLDALGARGAAAEPVGVMGISYGAATAIEWAGSDARVRAVVAVAPFSSLRAVVPGYAPFPLPARFIDGAIDLAGRDGGFDPEQASPVAAIARTRAPVLLVHGAADRNIPPWHSERIFAAAADHAELVRVPGADHGSIGESAMVLERALGWFARYLR